ncbi:Cof-type HAD-IIB family hydrolase [Variovorax sp. J22R133]|uniref:Cof-type HAD-IIB family hydrolase n=1 Tax=Variovorax brevis TaxID=3053503 RepID=UPI0025761DB6|nr:Cof-type HAD-IIB family hydrolase [Variovorax sp. J22R133]MDM0110743.1 Cof-type HAD-IIB family hydrolase [Variovorax sp. J22R133]
MSTADIRLVVCDIDGTLVRHDKSLSSGNIEAAKRLVATGTQMTLISARPMSGMQWIAEALHLDGPFGAFNGGTVFHRTNGVIGQPTRFTPELALRILSILDAAQVDVWLFAHDRWYARDALNPHVPREKLSAGIDPTLRPDLENLCDAVDKIVGVSDDAPLLKQLEATLLGATRDEATVALSQPYFLDATPLLANKGDGVAAVAAAMGVPLQHVAVIGDMPNDLPMFARAGLSIAMGQAPDSVRAAADWVTASNEDDGVARAIERLIRERTA